MYELHLSYKTSSGIYPLQVLNILLREANKSVILSASGWLLAILIGKSQLHCISQRQRNMTDSSCRRWLPLHGRLMCIDRVMWECLTSLRLWARQTHWTPVCGVGWPPLCRHPACHWVFAGAALSRQIPDPTCISLLSFFPFALSVCFA